jgi:plasmid stability protein
MDSSIYYGNNASSIAPLNVWAKECSDEPTKSSAYSPTHRRRDSTRHATLYAPGQKSSLHRSHPRQKGGHCTFCLHLTALPAPAIIHTEMSTGEESIMANLSVRKLDDDVYEQLRIRAAKHGVSMEEEVRQIICQVVKAPDKLSDVFHKHFGRNNGVDLNTSDQHQPHHPMDFNE